MNKAIITAARPERLKIVAFLLRLADWEVKVYNQMPEAVNYLKNADRNGINYDLLVVADYSTLGTTEQDRVLECQCLQICDSFNQAIPIIVAGNTISDREKQQLSSMVVSTLDFCSSDHLINHIETIHDQLQLQGLHSSELAASKN